MHYYAMYRRGHFGYYTCYALLLFEWLADPNVYFLNEGSINDSFMMVPPVGWDVVDTLD